MSFPLYFCTPHVFNSNWMPLLKVPCLLIHPWHFQRPSLQSVIFFPSPASELPSFFKDPIQILTLWHLSVFLKAKLLAPPTYLSQTNVWNIIKHLLPLNCSYCLAVLSTKTTAIWGVWNLNGITTPGQKPGALYNLTFNQSRTKCICKNKQQQKSNLIRLSSNINFYFMIFSFTTFWWKEDYIYIVFLMMPPFVVVAACYVGN